MTRARSLTARDIMTSEVITLQVEETAEDAVRLLLDASITGAPVIDTWGNAVGTFTLSNAADLEGTADHEGTREGSAHREKTGARAGEERFPEVGDRNGGPTDEYYRLDFRRGIAEPLARKPAAATGARRLADFTVGQLMTPRVHSVPDDCSVREVVGYLLDRSIHRVLVRDAENKLVGIITSVDLLRVLSELLEAEDPATDA